MIHEAHHPLSADQKLLLLAHQARPDAGLNNWFIYGVGKLDVARFREAVRLVSNLFAPLRTAIVKSSTGEPMQLTCAPLDESPCLLDDLRETYAAPDYGFEPAFRHAQNLAGTPFLLDTENLSRFRLIRYADELYLFLFVQHHIVFDGPSGQLFTAALSIAYSRGVAGLTERFGALARGDREVLNPALSISTHTTRAYWKDKFCGVDPVFDFGVPRRSSQTIETTFSLGVELKAAIEGLAQKVGASPFLILCGALAVFLHIYWRREDFLVGYPVNARPPGQADSFGFHVHECVWRFSMRAGENFNQLIERLVQQRREDRKHQDIDTHHIMEALDTACSPASVIGVNVLVARAYLSNQLHLDDAVATPVAVGVGQPSRDLSLLVDPDAPSFTCRMMGDAVLFPAELLDHLSLRYRELVATLVATPDLTLPNASEAGKEQLAIVTPQYATWLSSAGESGRLDRLFDEAASRYPDNVAVEDAGECWTYKTLDICSERLANDLRAAGIGAEDRVGICARPSIHLIIGILAILKAGAAFVPLDRNHPRQRIRALSCHAALKVVVTEPSSVGQLEGFLETLVVPIHSVQTAVARSSTEPAKVKRGSNSSHAAYVIYTSGSTGAPKGVVVEHGQAVTRLTGLQAMYPLESSGAYLLKTNVTFDVSVTELFGWMFGGARLVIPAEGVTTDASLLAACIRNRGITHLNFVPSLLASFMNSIDAPDLSGATRLRWLFIAGEALPPAIALEAYAKLPPTATLINLYGPTEATVYATAYSIPRSLDEMRGVPIGSPLSGTIGLVLDQDGGCVPIGVVGELCISGYGIARGYFGEPSLTATRFTQARLAPGCRMYRSGDRVRYLPGGNLEFHGRIDTQIKLRGVRIETAEVEEALLAHQHVAQAAVVVAGEGYDARLVAYFVPARGQGAAVSAGELVQHLRTSLPHSMIPSRFVSLDDMPTTSSGKIDRTRLASMAIAESSSDKRNYVAPISPLHSTLATMWRLLLRVDRVGIRDSFFELGGTSILAMQLAARIEQQLDCHVDIGQIFSNGTIEDLARIISSSSSTITYIPRVDRDSTELSFAQERIWYGAQLYSPRRYNLWTSIDIEANFNADTAREAVALLIESHDSLRMGFRNGSEHLSLFVQPTAVASFQTLDLSCDEASRLEALRRVVEGLADTPFSLEYPPLIRFLAVNLGFGVGKLFFCVHHIVADAWSLATLRTQLAEMYNVSRERRPPVHPERSVRYIDYAVWDRSPAVEQDRIRRAQVLADDLALVRPPPYLPHESELEHLACQEAAPDTSDGSFSFSVDCGLLTRTAAVAQRHGVTVSAVLHTVYALTVGLLTGNDDITIGTAFANRGKIQLEAAVGVFVNVLPLRIVLNRGESYKETLFRVNRRFAQLLSNQDVPLQLVMAELRRRASGSGVPSLDLWPYAINVLEYPGKMEIPQELFSALCARGGDAGLTLHIRIGVGTLDAVITYKSERFTNGTIAAFSRRYVQVLQKMVGNSDSLWATSGVFDSELSARLGIPPARIQYSVPLTPIQQDMKLRADRYYDGKQIIGAWRELEPTLSLETWREAFSNLFQMEPALRSRIVSYAGQTFQVFADFDEEQVVIGEPIPPAIQIDESLVWDYIREDVASEHAQTSRVLLFPCSRGGGLIIVYGEHTVADGASISAICRDAHRTHARLVKGLPYERRRSEDPLTFYAHVQHRYAEDRVEYWTKRLARAHPLAGASFPLSGAAQQVSWSLVEEPEEVALAAYARALGVSLFDVIVGAYALLLFRLFRPKGDFVLYEPVRPARYGRSVGTFLEVRRILFEGSLFEASIPISEYVERVAALRHSDTPALTLTEEAGLMAAGHVFSVNCIPTSQAPGWAPLNSVSPNETQLTFYAGLQVRPGETKCAFSLTSDDSRVVETGLIARFRRTLQEILSGRCLRTSDLAILCPAETHQLMVEWNGADLPLPADVCVQDLFQSQARQRPDALAVVHGDAALSYSDLNNRSTRVAAFLQRQCGFSAGMLVGLFVQRGVNMIIGMLGILKAGGAYVPVDTDYPSERIASMMRDSKVQIIVSEFALTQRAERLCVNGETLVLCDHLAFDNQAPTELPVKLAHAHSPAYVLYTSGSTGRPKGVVVNHISLLNLALAMKEAYRIDAADRILQHTSLSFDMSVEEIYPYLIAGATVVIGTAEVAIAEVIIRNRISILNILPFYGSVLAALSAELKAQVFESLRLIAFGGDVLSSAILDRLRNWGAEIFNAYGPTECTVNTTLARLTTASEVSIGKPIANMRAYVLNDALELVAVGIPGELFIGGVGVSPGYLGQAELTALAFMDNPFSATGAMYRTGDTARWRKDGTLEFLGRSDRQTKVHGYRVECGEVEAALLEHHGVSACAVLASAVGRSSVLIAFFVAADASEVPDASELVAFLEKSLPAFMVPGTFVPLEVLPKANNGKIDYRALAALEGNVAGRNSRAEPITDLEQLILSIWEEVLEVREVSVNDNFFALGGDSLRALQLLSRVNNEMSTGLSIRQIFEAPTVRRFAEAVSRHPGTQASQLFEFTRHGRKVIL